MKRLLILATLLILTACAAATDSPTPTASPSPTATATITPPPTVTPSITPSPTLPIPTPVFPASQVAHSLLLSTGTSPTCELPCWHDLQIGASTQADVEHVFSELFGAEEGFDFFAPPANPDSYLEGLLNLDGVYAGGHNWYFEESETGVFGTYYLHAYMDKNTGLLSGIRELINPYSLYEVPTLPEILERLGKPDWLYGGRAGSTFTVDLYYEQGINIQLSITFMLLEDYDTVMICFDKIPISGVYSLTEPFVDLAEEGWSPIIGQVPQEPAPYIDEDLRVSSIDEFIEFVNSEYPCFEMPRFE